MALKRLSLLSICLLVVYLVWVVSRMVGADVDFADVATVAGLIVGIFALVPSRNGDPVRASSLAAEESEEGLNISGAIIGGFLGGCPSGFAFSLLYNSIEPRPANPVLAIPEITLALAIAFTVLVVITRLTVALAKPRPSTSGLRQLVERELKGSFLGALGAGLVVGLPLGWHFGAYKDVRPFTPPEYLIATLTPGCVIAAILFVLAEENPGRLAAWKAFGSGLLCALVWGSFGYAVSDVLHLESAFQHLMYSNGHPVWHLIGGSIYGGFVAAFLGLTMGSSSFLAKLWIRSFP